MADYSLKAVFGVDNSGMRSGLQESGDIAAKYSGDIAGKVGDKLFGIRDVSRTVATALGLNLENIAENIARLFTGMSKAEEDAYKKSADLSTQDADLAIKNMQARMTDEQKYQMLLDTRDKLERQLATSANATGVAQEEQQKKTLELNKTISEIQVMEAKQAAEQQKAADAYSKTLTDNAEKVVTAYNSTLEAAQKVSAIEDEIAIKEASINAGLFTGATLEEQKNFLAQRQLDLIAAQDAADKAAAADRKKAFDERDTATQAYAQVLFDQKSKEEQLVILEKEKRDLQTEMNGLGKDTTLYMQDAVDLAKIEKDIRDRTLPTEKDITKEKAKQVSAALELVKIKQAETAGGDLGVMQLVGGEVSYNNPADQRAYEAQLMASAKNEIDAKIADYTQRIADLRASGSSYGAYDIPIYQQNIQALQQRESNVHDYVFSPSYQDQLGPGLAAEQTALISQVVDVSTQTRDALTAISNQLAGSPLFPKKG